MAVAESTAPATVTVADKDVEVPAAVRHFSIESLIQNVTSNAVGPMRPATLVSAEPKSDPNTIRLEALLLRVA